MRCKQKDSRQHRIHNNTQDENTICDHNRYHTLHCTALTTQENYILIASLPFMMRTETGANVKHTNTDKRMWGHTEFREIVETGSNVRAHKIQRRNRRRHRHMRYPNNPNKKNYISTTTPHMLAERISFHDKHRYDESTRFLGWDARSLCVALDDSDRTRWHMRNKIWSRWAIHINATNHCAHSS